VGRSAARPDVFVAELQFGSTVFDVPGQVVVVARPGWCLHDVYFGHPSDQPARAARFTPHMRLPWIGILLQRP
jgi:hypothetical protein